MSRAAYLEIATQELFCTRDHQLDTETLSDEALLEAYKSQQKVERGFRFLKLVFYTRNEFFECTAKGINELGAKSSRRTEILCPV